jgi:hypothetical protein
VTRLALGTRQRVFRLRFRVQENREILADLPEALRQHFSRRRADDHVVAILHGPAEQFIAHSATDGEDLHENPNAPPQWPV